MELKTTVYGSFRGVDRASDPTDIDLCRSPYAPNLISGKDGFPEKRPGWRVLQQLDGPIRAIAVWSVGGEKKLFVHAGSDLWWGDESGLSPLGLSLCTGSERTLFFAFESRLWFLGAGEYLRITDNRDGTVTVQDVRQIAYLPLITISRSPSGGGESYEQVNLLNPARRVGFLSDGQSTVYQLPSSDIDSVDAVLIGGQLQNAETDYTVDLQAGTVTFSTAPPKPEEDGGLAGEDWVEITYSVTVEGYAERILNCSITAAYGYGGNDRIILSGNPDYPSFDWTSGLRDATYFPDLSYAAIGQDSTAVMGYARVGEYLAILKEESDRDNTVFFRSAALNGEGEVIFPVRQAVTGIGMSCKNTVAVIDDEPLFFSRNGIYAITSNALTYERTVQNRSWYIDNDLTRDAGRSDAMAVRWDNRYLLSTGNAVYLLDGNQNHSFQDKTSGDYVYECYEWYGIPAYTLYADGDTLYFGTKDGRLCRFNTDIGNMTRYSDGGSLQGTVVTGGQAIDAAWATRADDDGDFMRYKTMVRHGCGVQIKPFTRSGVQVSFRTEQDYGNDAFSQDMDIFDWEDIDFGRFTFLSVDSPQVVPFRWRIRRYVTLQIIVRNNRLNEGFGVLGIVKRYLLSKSIR